MSQVPDIPVAADLQNLEFYSKENFLCEEIGTGGPISVWDRLWSGSRRGQRCTGCEHELSLGQRRKWTDVTLFNFNETSKIGEGGFRHVNNT